MLITHQPPMRYKENNVYFSCVIFSPTHLLLSPERIFLAWTPSVHHGCTFGVRSHGFDCTNRFSPFPPPNPQLIAAESAQQMPDFSVDVVACGFVCVADQRHGWRCWRDQRRGHPHRWHRWRSSSSSKRNKGLYYLRYFQMIYIMQLKTLFFVYLCTHQGDAMDSLGARGGGNESFLLLCTASYF